MRKLQRLTSDIKASECATLCVVNTPRLANSVIPKAVSHLRTLHPDSAIEMNFSPTQLADSMLEIDTPALIVDLDALERNMRDGCMFPIDGHSIAPAREGAPLTGRRTKANREWSGGPVLPKGK